MRAYACLRFTRTVLSRRPLGASELAAAVASEAAARAGSATMRARRSDSEALVDAVLTEIVSRLNDETPPGPMERVARLAKNFEVRPGLVVASDAAAGCGGADVAMASGQLWRART